MGAKETAEDVINTLSTSICYMLDGADLSNEDGLVVLAAITAQWLYVNKATAQAEKLLATFTETVLALLVEMQAMDRPGGRA